MALAAILIALAGLAAMLAVRVLYMLFVGRSRPMRAGSGPVKTMVVLGSGGHTAEMLMLVERLDKAHYAPRVYVAAASDRMSGHKALTKEQAWGGGDQGAARLEVIPRSREVGQSYATSVATTLYSLAFAAWVVLRQRPRLLLVNGPGTCIPVCAAAFLYRALFFLDCRIVYVESIARVERLSLSGRILHLSRAADALFVQWPEMAARFRGTTYAGRLY
ncbi:MAG: oligosaccharide biosynthesis protein Alg14-like protein [Monoraphidium minutum]|nr:MAG: oligosaccharide biosynthesis protein Alg14-like protein [Monoraphidium minutum]